MSRLSRNGTFFMVGAVGLLFAPLAMALPGTPVLTATHLRQAVDLQTMAEERTLNSHAKKIGYRVHLGFGGLAGYSEYGNYGGGSSGYPARGYYDQDYSEYRRNDFSPSYNFKPKVRRAPLYKGSRYKRSRYKRRIRIRPR